MTSAGRDDTWLFATLVAVTTTAAVVSSLGAPLVPSIAAEHGVAISTAQWILTAALVAAAATTPVLGRWGSGRLRRPVMLGGLGVVLAGLVIAALPTGIGGLIIGRALQGVGLGLAPLALAVGRDAWSGALQVSRLSLLSIATVAGAGLGYPVTAVVAGQAGVAGAYWLGAVVVVLTLGMAVRHLPRAVDVVAQRVDVVGAGLLAVGVVALLLVVSQGERWGWLSPTAVTLALAGSVLVALWIARSLRVARGGGHPLVDLTLATRAGMLGPNTVAFALSCGMYGLLTLVVLLVQADGSDGWGLGLGVAAAGMVLVPYSLLSVAGSRLAIRIARRYGGHLLLPIGCGVFASAMVLCAFLHDHLWQTLVVMAVGGLGSGFTFSSLPMLIVPQVTAAETGSAMAFNQLLRYLGFSVGSASSVALLEVYGGGRSALQGTALTLAVVCLAAGSGVFLRAAMTSRARKANK